MSLADLIKYFVIKMYNGFNNFKFVKVART